MKFVLDLDFLFNNNELNVDFCLYTRGDNELLLLL